MSEEPVLSVLRNFSAPVKVRLEQTDAELGLRLAHDSDPWARWDAGQTLALRALLAGVAAFRRTGRCPAPPEALVQGMAALLDAMCMRRNYYSDLEGLLVNERREAGNESG